MSNARYIAAAGLVFGAAVYLWPKASPGIPGAPSPTSALKTTGVENVEKAYTRAGATATHTKAYGGTIQGQAQDGALREGGSTNKPNAFEQEGMGEDQRGSAQSPPERAWKKTMYGSEKGK